MKTNDPAAAEDFLALLCFGLEKILNPSPANILKSFSSWNYENRLKPQLRLLERARLVERHRTGNASSYRVTEAGRRAVGGGCDPKERWDRSWDGHWRLALFDVPTPSHSSRVRLWRWMRQRRFGYLQNSVWITPDPVDLTQVPLKQKEAGADVFLCLEARPSAGFSDSGIVQAAWDFQAINGAYQAHLDILDEAGGLLGSDVSTAQARRWLTRERMAWLAGGCLRSRSCRGSCIHPVTWERLRGTDVGS